MDRRIIILIIITVVLFNSAFAQNTGNALMGLSQDKIEVIYNQTKIFPNRTQVSIAFINNGLIEYYGVIKQDNTLMLIDNKDKLFEIGSITKIFTATLLANAVLDNRIGLGDDINTFYNFPFKDSISINFLSLSNHTSGLGAFPSNLEVSEFLDSPQKATKINPYQKYGEIELEAYLKDEIQLKDSSKRQYSYSNFGTGLLGYTLSILYGNSYGQLLSDKIFQKYNMANSYITINQAETELVKGLDSEGNDANNWDWDSDVIIGAGGILSTTKDLAKFVNAQFNPDNRELALTRIPTFTINEKMRVGLGWHIIDNGNNHILYFHNGGTGGYSSSMVFDANAKKGVLILSNVSAFHPDMNNIDSMCFQLMEIIR